MNIKALSEVAKEWGLKPNTLQVAAGKGRLPAHKSGKTWLVDLDDPEVQNYKTTFAPKEHKDEVKDCLVCGKPVPRARAKYCSQGCYATTF